MSTKDYLEKDYYDVLGVPKDATRGRDQEGLPQARPELPPGREPGRRRGRGAFKEISEAYDVLSDAKRRKEYDEARTLFGAAAAGSRAARPVRAARAAAPFDLGDLFGGTGGRAGAGGHRRPLRRAVRRRRAGRPAAPPRPRRRRRDRGDALLRRAVDGRDRAAAADQRRPLPDLPRHRRPRPAPCRESARPARAPAMTSRNQGGFAFAEPCRDCRGRGLVVDDPCPDCHGSGRRA